MLTASINVTCDGFCNHEDVVADAEFSALGAELVEAADRLLLGRKTFELFEGYWPAAANDPATPAADMRLARAIVDTPRTVLSRTLDHSQWTGTDFLADLDKAAAADLARNQDVLLLGSPSILTLLAGQDAIDRYVFVIHPIVAAGGVRLFENAAAKQPALRSAASRTLASGVQVMELVRAD